MLLRMVAHDSESHICDAAFGGDWSDFIARRFAQRSVCFLFIGSLCAFVS